MTTVDSVAGPRTAVSRRLAPLIGKEVRHFARHPVLWLIPPIVVVTASLDAASAGRNAAYWYGTIFVAVAFFVRPGGVRIVLTDIVGIAARDQIRRVRGKCHIQPG